MTQLALPYDQDLFVSTAFQDARTLFSEFAAMDSPNVPENLVDATQVLLCRWQNTHFGLQSDERMILGMIEEITEGAVALDAHDALDALGDCCVYGSQLLTSNRLAIRPVIELAEHWLLDGVSIEFGGFATFKATSPEIGKLINHCQGVLAQVGVKGAQKVRGYEVAFTYQRRLVGAVASCFTWSAFVAQGHLHHEPVDIEDTFLTVGERVAKRGEGHDAIPKLSVH